MIMICVFQLQQKIKKKRLERYTCSISDFSICITKLPSTFHMEDLIAFIHARVSTTYPDETFPPSLNLVKSYKLFDLKLYSNLYAHKVKCISNRIKAIKLARELEASITIDNKNVEKLKTVHTELKRLETDIQETDE